MRAFLIVTKGSIAHFILPGFISIPSILNISFSVILSISLMDLPLSFSLKIEALAVEMAHPWGIIPISLILPLESIIKST